MTELLVYPQNPTRPARVGNTLLDGAHPKAHIRINTPTLGLEVTTMGLTGIKHAIARIRRFFATPFGTQLGYREPPSRRKVQRTGVNYETIC